MKRNIFKITFLVSVMMLFGACNKEYLETKPTDRVAEGDILKTTGNLMTALNGIHRAMYMQYSNQNEAGQASVEIHSDMLGEDLVMTAAGNGWFNNTYMWKDHRNENSSMVYFGYRFYYKIIDNANRIISNIDQADGPIATKKSIKGQALTYRAWAHFNLVQLFGIRYDATAKPNSQMGVPIMLASTNDGLGRSSVEEVYTQINKDLDDAILSFDGADSRANKSHLNINVAKGIKARVALTQQNWVDAAKYAAEARVGFKLMGATDLTAGFNNYTNTEWLWGSTVVPDQTTYFYSFYAYMSYNFSSTNIRGNPKAVNSLLYNAFPATDFRKAWFVPAPTASNPVLASTFTKKPYMNVKFKAADAADSRGDVVYMRASELYLMEAEAKARLNDPTAANVLFDFAITRDPSYVKSTKVGQNLIDEILLQRRFELWGEGFRFLDLKRLNAPLNRNGANHTASLVSVFDIPAGDKQWQWLLPKAELNANKAISSQQNPL